MIDVGQPSARPLHVLRSVLRQDAKSKVRLVEDVSGSTFIEADFDHAPVDLRGLLSLLDDIGWAPVPEELDCAPLTVDGLGARIRVRFLGERVIGEY